MNTITIQPPKGLSLKKAITALKNLNFTIIEENDPTKMSKEEFFDKIDRARKSEKIEMSFEELEKRMLQ